MPSSYSPKLRLELMATGENRSTWGNKANNDFNLIEAAIAGVTAITMADANVTLTIMNGVTDQARSAVLVFTGTTTASRTITLPTVSKTYIVRNATAFPLVFTTSAIAPLTTSVPSLGVYAIYTDGTDTYLVSPILNKAAVGLDQVDNTSDVNKPISTAQATGILSAMPVGSIISMAGKTAPTGWLTAAGMLVSRTSYANLWAMAQASANIAASDAVWNSSSLFGQFSPGDGSTTFRLPYLAGYFIRPWVASGGADSGRAIGTLQTSQNLSHNHTLTDPGHIHTVSQTAHSHGVSDPGHAHTILAASNDTGNGYPALNGNNTQNVATAGAFTGISIGAANANVTVVSHATGITLAADGGTEARPQNIALPYYIKY